MRPRVTSTWTENHTCLRLIPRNHAPSLPIPPSPEHGPAEPPVQNVSDRSQEGPGTSSLSASLLSLHGRNWNLLDGRATPPDLETALRVGKGTFCLESHRLDETARIDRHILIVMQRKPEQKLDEQVIHD